MRRRIPAVSKILDALGHSDLPRRFVVEIVRRELSQIRASSAFSEFDAIVAHIRRALDAFRTSRLQPIINGTGIVIHTNFGRAPLPGEAMRALNEIGAAYSNLEYDLAKGGRGGRGVYVETALALLCEAQAATVVNNCAAALVLIVQHFTRKTGRARASGAPEVVISRGELVQIGGGFRITAIDLETEADVPGIDDAKFQEQAELTKKNCPVSVALSGTQINLRARLASR